MHSYSSFFFLNKSNFCNLFHSFITSLSWLPPAPLLNVHRGFPETKHLWVSDLTDINALLEKDVTVKLYQASGAPLLKSSITVRWHKAKF